MMMHYTTFINQNRYMDVTELDEYRNASPFKRIRMFAARLFDLSYNPTVLKEMAEITSANNHEAFKNFTSGKAFVTPVTEDQPLTEMDENAEPKVKLATVEEVMRIASKQASVPGVNVAIVNGDHVFTKDNNQKTNICNLMFNKDKYQEKKAVYEEGIAELLTAVKEGLTFETLVPIGSKFRGMNRIVIKNDKMNKEVKTEMFYGLVDALQETGADLTDVIDSAVRLTVGKVLHDAGSMKATDVSKALYTAYMVATIYQCAKTVLKEQGNH